MLLRLIVFISLSATSVCYGQIQCTNLFSQKKAINETGQLIQKLTFGNSKTVNLRMLRNLEEIPPEVLERYYQELELLPKFKAKDIQKSALSFIETNSKRDKNALFSQLQRLVPIALRPILHHLKNKEDVDDYLQTGYLKLWDSIENLRTASSKTQHRQKMFHYWLGTMNGIRATIFLSMRALYRTQYSLTPVKFAKTSEFTFEEAVLLFAENSKDISEIAEYYGKTEQEVMRELNLQKQSMNNDIETELAYYSTLNKSDYDLALKLMVEKWLSYLPERNANILKSYYVDEKTLDQIAKEYRVSPENVRQIIARSIRSIKSKPKAQRQAEGFLQSETPTKIRLVNQSIPQQANPKPNSQRASPKEITEHFAKLQDAQKHKREEINQLLDKYFLKDLVRYISLEPKNHIILVKMIGKFKVDHKKIFSNRLKHLRRETEKYINFLQIETPWRVINKDTTPAPLTLREIEFLLKEFTDSNMEDVMYYNSLIKIKKDKLRAQGFATDY